MAIIYYDGLDVNGTVDLTNLTVSSSQGTDGQVLTSTGSGVAWEDVSGGSSPWSTDTNGITYTAGNAVSYTHLTLPTNREV